MTDGRRALEATAIGPCFKIGFGVNDAAAKAAETRPGALDSPTLKRPFGYPQEFGGFSLWQIPI
jgi:hypothetical protein